jgi:hypothetical protein
MPKPFLNLALFLAGSLSGLACATTQKTPARTPPPEQAAAYFPLAPGWKWAYEIEKSGEKILATYAVLQQTGDTVIIQAGEERNGYAILPEGIARREDLNPGDFILKTPIRAGATWPLAGGKATVVAVGEDVTVPAGTYANCAVVEEARSSPNRVLRTTYAAGVGPIALEYQVSNPETRTFDVVLRARLLGFTRPGGDPLGNETAGSLPAKPWREAQGFGAPESGTVAID